MHWQLGTLSRRVPDKTRIKQPAPGAQADTVCGRDTVCGKSGSLATNPEAVKRTAQETGKSKNKSTAAVVSPSAGLNADVNTHSKPYRGDNHLMMAYVGGDADAFDQLYARHKLALFRFISKSCQNDALAQELYQEVWLRVIRSRETYRRDAPFKAWLYRIARNRLVDHYRQQPRRITVELETDSSNASTLFTGPLAPDEIASLSERAHVLNDALNTLPPAQREAILLRHLAGMSIKEVASVVNEGIETVRSRLRYATARLRSQLRKLS